MPGVQADKCVLLQALCFLAGANSIFDGDKLLTTPNNERSEDMKMFELLGLRSRPAFLHMQDGTAVEGVTTLNANPEVTATYKESTVAAM